MMGDEEKKAYVESKHQRKKERKLKRLQEANNKGFLLLDRKFHGLEKPSAKMPSQIVQKENLEKVKTLKIVRDDSIEAEMKTGRVTYRDVMGPVKDISL